MSDGSRSTVGGYLATRLEQVGIKHYFAVPGDYNLILLDEFLKNPNKQNIVLTIKIKFDKTNW